MLFPWRIKIWISTTCSWVNIIGGAKPPRYPRWVSFGLSRWVSFTLSLTPTSTNSMPRRRRHDHPGSVHCIRHPIRPGRAAPAGLGLDGAPTRYARACGARRLGGLHRMSNTRVKKPLAPASEGTASYATPLSGRWIARRSAKDFVAPILTSGLFPASIQIQFVRSARYRSIPRESGIYAARQLIHRPAIPFHRPTATTHPPCEWTGQ